MDWNYTGQDYLDPFTRRGKSSGIGVPENLGNLQDLTDEMTQLPTVEPENLGGATDTFEVLPFF